MDGRSNLREMCDRIRFVCLFVSLSAQGKLVGSSASPPGVETNGGPRHKSGESLVGFNRMQAISTGVETNDGLNRSVQDIITTNF